MGKRGFIESCGSGARGVPRIHLSIDIYGDQRRLTHRHVNRAIDHFAGVHFVGGMNRRLGDGAGRCARLI